MTVLNDSHAKSSTEGHFYFFHLIDKSIKLDAEGLVSPQYMYDSGKFEEFDTVMRNYHDRITGSWGIYPGKSKLTRHDYITALKQFRHSEDALSWIYFFRYPPYLGLGKNIAKSITGKKVLRVDLLELEREHAIKGVDWKFWLSHSDNTPLTRDYFERIQPDEYFKVFDDNHIPVFATLNHISIHPSNGYLERRFLVEFELPETLGDLKELL